MEGGSVGAALIRTSWSLGGKGGQEGFEKHIVFHVARQPPGTGREDGDLRG